MADSESESFADHQRSPRLQLSEIGLDQLHNAAFESLNVGVWKHDIVRNMMSWGPEVETLLGVRPSSSPAETFFGLMLAEERPYMMSEFQKCLQERKAFRLDFRIQRVDGSICWVASTGLPFFDPDGRPTHIIGTVRDVTEQKLAELWLRKQNDVLRTIALGVPTATVFESIASMLREGMNALAVAMLIPDPRGRLRVAAGIHLPAEYEAAIEAIDLNEPACLCSRSFVEGQTLSSADLGNDPRVSSFRPMFEKYGWASCVTCPIKLTQSEDNPAEDCLPVPSMRFNHHVAGLIAIYRSQRGHPNENELEKLAQAANLATIVIARDRSRQSLLESEKRFRELANAMPQLVWTNDAQGRCNYGNRLLKETIGERGVDDWPSIIHPEDRERTFQRFVEAVQTGSPYSVEHRLLVQSTQSYRWFLGRAIPSRDGDGNINAWYGAATDIDDLKRIEAALREERDRLAALASTCPSVLFTYMQTADGRHTFPYAAPAIGDLLAVDPLKIQSNAMCLIDRVSRDDLRRLKNLLSDATNKMSTFEATFPVQHPQKGTVWVECQASPCKLADGQICWHGTLTDITRRKMLETQVLQSEKLQAIGRLAGGVAHDFNNMLTVIISACHVLDSQLASGSSTPTDQSQPENENVDAIRQAALRAASLTKQLLAFSRQQPTAPQQLNLNAVITQSEGILARLVGQSITLQTELADNLKLVFADPSQIEQILVNLVINSRDAITHEGRIKIVTRTVVKPADVADHQRPNVFVEIEVTDNGCGMSQETLIQIFDPFFTTKPIGKGTGLGLAVVHGIVTQNGGTIEVESEVNKGTTFRILLPTIHCPAVQHSEVHKTGPLEGGTEGVLVVDDEPVIGKMTTKTLRSLGYTVFTANSPDEAEQLFQGNRQSIDILLTDLLMPGCNGVELANRLLDQKSDLRVIVMSGHRTSSFDNSDVARTGYRFLPKPYTTLELSSALRAVIED